jgi:hypothetical protein
MAGLLKSIPRIPCIPRKQKHNGWMTHMHKKHIQGESKKTDTFDIQMNNKGVSFF